MPNEPDRNPPELQGGIAISLIAVLACTLAGEALAIGTPTDRAVDKPELALRITTVVEQIRRTEPTVLRELPPDSRIAQWGND